MSRAPPIELLIFDCDGVLVDSEVIALRVLETELGARLPGLDVPRIIRDTAGMTTEAILHLVERQSGRHFAPGTLEALRVATDRALDRELEPLPGVFQALEAISLDKAVASNSILERVSRSLARAGLTEVFGDRVFAADMVAEPKPSPELYQLASTRLGVPPDRCLVVEDSVTGTTAARLAGMSVIGFTGAGHVPTNQGERLRLVGAIAVVEHMQDLPAVVKGYMA
jgi:HAD superfamily hydrolase (TIGR01509 family)